MLDGLEANFRSQNKLIDANKAHYHMKMAELEEKTKDKPYRGLNTWEFWEWILWGWNSGYGTKIWWIIWWYFVFYLIFVGIYYAGCNYIERETTDESKPDSEVKSRLLNFPWDFTKSKVANDKLIDFFTALRFSKVLLFKIGRRDIKASNKDMIKIFGLIGLRMSTVVWVEWILGTYLLVIFLITLKNTVPIINSLLHGIF